MKHDPEIFYVVKQRVALQYLRIYPGTEWTVHKSILLKFQLLEMIFMSKLKEAYVVTWQCKALSTGDKYWLISPVRHEFFVPDIFSPVGKK
jgi:hypothetical protein